MIKMLAPALRIGGVLAGIGGMLLVSSETLAAGIAAAGLEARLAPPVARVAGLVIFALVGFIIGSRLAEMVARASAPPAGRRQDAVETVPRLRRHLVEGEGQPAGMATMRYLDPDPAPTAPVAVSFAELGLEPSAAGHLASPGEGEADEFLFARMAGRPDSAGSASDEWDDCPAPLPRATPPQPPVVAIEPGHEPRMPDEQLGSASDTGVDREPAPTTDAPLPDDFATVVEQIESLQARQGPADSEPAASRPAPAPVADAGTGEPAPGPVGNDGYSRPSFARPDASPDASWYDGAGDDEEEAEDDGAGYGSLIAIGLGKSHAPRGGGPMGEGGLPVRADGGGRAVVPHGKPQDFRLREALSELARLA